MLLIFLVVIVVIIINNNHNNAAVLLLNKYNYLLILIVMIVIVMIIMLFHCWYCTENSYCRHSQPRTIRFYFGVLIIFTTNKKKQINTKVKSNCPGLAVIVVSQQLTNHWISASVIATESIIIGQELATTTQHNSKKTTTTKT